jgi:hypothetical protein
MEAPGGVEPPTNGLGNRCSIQLSYGALVRLYFELQRRQPIIAMSGAVPANALLQLQGSCSIDLV